MHIQIAHSNYCIFSWNFGGTIWFFLEGQFFFFRRVDSAIYRGWINHFPLDNSIGFASVYPVDSDSVIS